MGRLLGVRGSTPVIAGPGRHGSGRWIQLFHQATKVAAEEPSGADKWVSGEGQLGGGGENPQLAGVRVVDIDGFGEAELGGEWLPALGKYGGPVENHAEGTTELTLAVAEDAYDVQNRHGASVLPSSGPLKFFLVGGHGNRLGRSPAIDLLSKFASHAGGGLPGVLAYLAQVPGERYADSHEM